MVQNLEKYKKNIAIDLRRRGFSYSEIQIQTKVPKSTLSSWLKNAPIDSIAKQKLTDRSLQTARTNIQRRSTRYWNKVEEIMRQATKDVGVISKKELWLMGVMLYWSSRISNTGSTDFKYGIRYTSSDPSLIWFFTMWLQKIGKIKKKDLRFDLFMNSSLINKKKIVIKYWSKVTGYSTGHFKRIYIKNKTNKVKKSDNNKEVNSAVNSREFKNQYGFLRVRVLSSSLLARQIAGWVEGIQNKL